MRKLNAYTKKKKVHEINRNRTFRGHSIPWNPLIFRKSIFLGCKNYVYSFHSLRDFYKRRTLLPTCSPVEISFDVANENEKKMELGCRRCRRRVINDRLQFNY